MTHTAPAPLPEPNVNKKSQNPPSRNMRCKTGDVPALKSSRCGSAFQPSLRFQLLLQDVARDSVPYHALQSHEAIRTQPQRGPPVLNPRKAIQENRPTTKHSAGFCPVPPKTYRGDSVPYHALQSHELIRTRARASRNSTGLSAQTLDFIHDH